MRDDLRAVRGALRRELQRGVPPSMRLAIVAAVEDVSRRLGSALHVGSEPDREGDAAALARAKALLESLGKRRELMPSRTA